MMAKTLQQIKDEVAIVHDWKSWADCYKYDGETGVMVDQIAIRYAQEQSKQLLAELEHVTKALKVVASLGATAPIIKRAEQLINKHKGDKS